jgi:hypothetical protein
VTTWRCDGHERQHRNVGEMKTKLVNMTFDGTLGERD